MKKNKNGIKKSPEGIKKTNAIKKTPPTAKSRLGKFDSDNLPEGMDKATFEKLIAKKKKKMNTIIAGGTIGLVILIIVLVMGLKSCMGSGETKAEKKQRLRADAIAKNMLKKSDSPYKKGFLEITGKINKNMPTSKLDIDNYILKLENLLEKHKAKAKYNDKYKKKINILIKRLENLKKTGGYQ